MSFAAHHGPAHRMQSPQWLSRSSGFPAFLPPCVPLDAKPAWNGVGRDSVEPFLGVGIGIEGKRGSIPMPIPTPTPGEASTGVATSSLPSQAISQGGVDVATPVLC